MSCLVSTVEAVRQFIMARYAVNAFSLEGSSTLYIVGHAVMVEVEDFPGADMGAALREMGKQLDQHLPTREGVKRTGPIRVLVLK